jgi:hypothetical protein
MGLRFFLKRAVLCGESILSIVTFRDASFVGDSAAVNFKQTFKTYIPVLSIGCCRVWLMGS